MDLYHFRPLAYASSHFINTTALHRVVPKVTHRPFVMRFRNMYQSCWPNRLPRTLECMENGTQTTDWHVRLVEFPYHHFCKKVLTVLHLIDFYLVGIHLIT
jgi:hypothetical protein